MKKVINFIKKLPSQLSYGCMNFIVLNIEIHLYTNFTTSKIYIIYIQKR